MNRILVATDGDPESAGAVRIAEHLAQGGAEVRALAVMEPVSSYTAGLPRAVPAFESILEERQAERLRERTAGHARALGADRVATSLVLETGSPAPVLARAAGDWDASLIVVGLGSHELVDRWFGTETAVRVAQLSPVPVLAVPASAAAPLLRCIAATDFSEFSDRALDVAAGLLEKGGELALVHVVPRPDFHDGDGAGTFNRIAAEARARLTELADSVEARHGIRASVHVREGDPARELLDLAGELGADLLAAGSHGHGFLGRLLLGSTSTRLLRGSRCSVLVAPPRGVVQISAPAAEASLAAVPREA